MVTPNEIAQGERERREKIATLLEEAIERIKSELVEKMSQSDEILVKVGEFGPTKSGHVVTLTLNQNGFRREPKSRKFGGIHPGMMR